MNYYDDEDFIEDIGIDSSNEITKFMKRVKKITKLDIDEKNRIAESNRKSDIKKILIGAKKIKSYEEFFAILTISIDKENKDPQNVVLDAKKRTVLHYVVNPELLGYTDESTKMTLFGLIEECLASGIDIEIKDIYGKTAADYCKDKDLVSFIKNYKRGK